MNDTAKTISVMLVDDSAVIRGALTRIIEFDPVIKVVASCMNGEIAVTAAEKNKPDVVILDIEMPVMDGLTALPKILQASPNSKVIMFSTLTEKGASHTMKAFSLGAVECLVKPSSTQSVGLGSEFQENIIAKIKGLAKIDIRPSPSAAGAAGNASPAAAGMGNMPVPARSNTTAYTLNKDARIYKGKPEIIAIGSSTGGPEALYQVLKNLKDLPVPIVITQHMPPMFTTILARSITQQTGIPAQEGAQDMPVRAGHAYIAPGGFHMKLVRAGTDVKITIEDGPPENYCKPAVDPMFRSVLSVYGHKALAVILTGMGSDGLKGADMMVQKGTRLIAQDQQTSVVWGMPGAVAQAGICSEVLPLQEIGPFISRITR